MSLLVSLSIFFVGSQVTIQVTDANDNSPVCPRLPDIELVKNAAVGTVVTALRVTDADIGINSQISFQSLNGQFASQFLEVITTGEIRTTA